MASRYFAFGCSYVDSRWGTLADLISANFDEYYNFGNAGACNTFICNRLIEADSIHNFNSETDYVTIGVTGIGRYSFVDKDENLWVTSGDILHGFLQPNNNLKTEKQQFIAYKLDSHNHAAYRSWVAIKTISTLLKAKNIKHKIYPSIDNLLYITDYNLPAHTLEKVKDILNICDIKESVDEYLLSRYLNRGVKYDDGCEDSHPSQEQYYGYLQAYFPEFDNEKTKNRFEYLEKIFDKSSMYDQTQYFMRFVKSTRSGRKGLWFP